MPVYLDNAATTRVCPEAARAALEAMTEGYGNPSSGYELGLDGMNERSVIITEDGFRVNGSPHGLNQEGTLYRYYAFL